MKKTFQKMTALCLAMFSLAGYAAENDKATQAQNIPQECKTLFTETENLIAQAEKQPGTHTQVSKIKSKLKQSKQHILEMELATQIKSCNVGLAKLNILKQQEQ